MAESPPWLKEAEDCAVRLVREAGSLLMERFQRPMAVEYKDKEGWRDPVTEADRTAETFLSNELAARFPHHGFVGEEGEGSSCGRGRPDVGGGPAGRHDELRQRAAVFLLLHRAAGAWGARGGGHLPAVAGHARGPRLPCAARRRRMGGGGPPAGGARREACRGAGYRSGGLHPRSVPAEQGAAEERRAAAALWAARRTSWR